MLNQVLMITNVCFEPYFRIYIKDRLSDFSKELQMNFVIFEEYRDYVDYIEQADIIVVCLNFEEFYSNIFNDIHSKRITYDAVEHDCIHKCIELYSYVKDHGKAPVIWFGFEDYCFLHNKSYGSLLFLNGLVDKLNLAMNDLLEEDVFVDFKRLIATVGMKNAYDTKGKYRWNTPYSKELISLIVDEIYKQHLIYIGKTPKCLVIDCDNVLWGGILTEDGIEGIKIGSSGIGRAFQKFQQYLLDLYYHGVILTVCSKNDEKDVLRIFNTHSGMLLKEDHIAYFQCNWNNKPENIKEISEILNIGLDSIVFVDDSIFEIESVKTMLPEVKTVLYQRDTVYDELTCFNLRYNTDIQTVRERTNAYKTNKSRAELKMNASSYEDYISSLEMVVDIHLTKEYELSRVSELTQRTNKCTNGFRYTIDQLKKLIQTANYQLYTVCLKDKFCDLGVIGVIGISTNCIDLFSLSCRALGRQIEHTMLKYVLELGVNSCRFCNTLKNSDLRKLFQNYTLKIDDKEKI